jgi:hypothetical protein
MPHVKSIGRRIALIMAGLAFCLMTVQVVSAVQTSRAIQYRMLTLSFPPPPSLLQSKLEEYGAEGWELVFVIPQSRTLIFKKP